MPKIDLESVQRERTKRLHPPIPARTMRAGCALFAALFLAAPAAGQDDSSNLTIRVNFVEPLVVCAGALNVAETAFGTLRRDDPCGVGTAKTGGVDVIADPLTATFSSMDPTCVALVPSTRTVGQLSVAAYNATSLTVGMEYDPPVDGKTDDTHTLAFTPTWAVSESGANAGYTLIPGAAYTEEPGGFWTDVERHFRVGGSLTIPRITDDAAYQEYGGTVTLTVTCI